MASTFPDHFRRRCRITILDSKVFGILTDYPVLLTRANLPSEMFDADGTYPAQNGGGDIRFSSDEAGSSRLSCEIVTFTTDNNPTNGRAEIYVKVPEIGDGDTDIYVWYNTFETDSQPAPSAAYGKYDVWSDGYEAVYHMNGTGNMENSANADNTLTRVSNPVESTGMTEGGKSQYCDTGFFRTYNPSSEIIESDTCTIEFFFNTDYPGGVGSPPYPSPFFIEKDGYEDAFRFEVIGSSPTNCRMSGRYRLWNSSVSTIGPNNFITLNEWCYYSLAISTVTTVYLKKRSSYPGENITVSWGAGGLYDTSGDDQIRIGDDANPTISTGFDGYIDECRISTSVRDSNYVNTMWSMYNSISQFTSAASPEYVEQIYNESVSDGILLGDSIYVGKHIYVSTEDGIKLGDSLSHTYQAEISVSDGLKLGDTPGVSATQNLTASDGIKLGDSTDAGFRFDHDLTDGIVLGDSVDRDMIYNPDLTDGIILSDEVVAHTSVDYPCDVQSEWVCEEEEWQDDLTIINEWYPRYYIYREEITDGFTFADEVQGLTTFAPSASDGIKMGDVLFGGYLREFSVSDGIKLGDTATVEVIFAAQVADGFAFGDSISVQLDYAPSATDGFVFGEQIGRQYDEYVTDGFSLGDQVAVTKDIFINISDGIQFSDVPSNTVEFVASLSDGIKFSEITGQVYYFDLEDGITLGDTLRHEHKYMVKAYFKSLDKTFTFEAKKKQLRFVAEEDGLTIQAKNNN